MVEGRGQPGGHRPKSAQGRTQSRRQLPPNLQRVNEVARRDSTTRFTTLLHHVDVRALHRAFRRQKRRASAGVDEVTVEQYEERLIANLRSLHQRLHTGGYRPLPVRRVYIPKADGSRRPLGIPALEDKIVQGAVAEVLSAIYEVDFLGFSYGFRPGRGPHDALRSLHKAIMTQYVNWVLDADLRRFFDSVDHEWLIRMVSHRIADPRVLTLIQGWLTAGVMEGNEWNETREGTPQGAGISPLLANVFLHYVLDLWVHQWRGREARGRVCVVRYADDFVLGFQYESDARRMMAALRERMGKFGQTLHAEKTRLIEFGRLRAIRARESGKRRLETFDFLGFTHYCGWTRDGRFILKRKTQRKKLTASLTRLRGLAKRRMHSPVAEQCQWLSRVLRGHYGYYGVRCNYRSLRSFYREICRIWYRALRRRSRCGMTWERFSQILASRPLPLPRITQTY
jgi:RNA-directed DNA polymerase